MRLVIRETADGLGIHNPARRSAAMVAFLVVWLAGWSTGEWFALSEFITTDIIPVRLFLLVWLTFWTVGGLAVIFVVLWQLFGAERVFVTAGAVVHEIGLGPFRRKRMWPASQVGAFRLVQSRPAANRSFPGYRVAFDAGGKTQKIGATLDEQEARQVFAAIARHVGPAAIEPQAAGG